MDSERDGSTYADTSLLLEENRPELVELTIQDGKYLPSGACEWRKTGESIARNTHLKKLTFWNSIYEKVTEEDVQRFFCGVAENSSIQTLHFASVPLHKELLTSLVPFFRNNHNFENLHISRCTCENTHWLASVLLQFTSLKEFALLDDKRGYGSFDGQLQPVLDALSSHSGLRKLQLRGTCIGEEAFTALTALLQNAKSNLVSLVLDDTDINNQVAAALETVLASNSALRQLSLNSNGVIWRWMGIFAALCDSSCGIEQLDISNNFITDADAHVLADLLPTYTSLKCLNISCNRHITTVGWRAIFVALQSPACVLETLSVENNLLGDATAVLPAVLAHANSSLETLDLRNTLIDDATAVALADALVGNDTLTELILDNNDDIAIASIQSLSTGNQVITLRGLSAFLRALCNPLNIMSTFQSNHTLQRFSHGTSSSHLFTSERIQSLLCLNRENSTREAARLKIIETHFRGPEGFAVEPFVDMDLVVLPNAMAWMSRRGAGGGIDEHFYGFLRNTKAWLAGVDAQVNRKAKKRRIRR